MKYFRNAPLSTVNLIVEDNKKEFIDFCVMIDMIFEVSKETKEAGLSGEESQKCVFVTLREKFDLNLKP